MWCEFFSRRSDVDGSAVDDAPRHSDELACKGQTRPSANLRPRPQKARGTTPYLHTNPGRTRYRLTRYLFLDRGNGERNQPIVYRA